MDARTEALSALSQFLVARATVGDTLQRVAEITTGALPAAEFAGLALPGPAGRPSTRIYTNPEAPEIDAAQYQADNGPCLDAWRERRIVRSDDIAAARDEYPEFVEACLAQGVTSTLSLPLLAGGEGIGALNLYARGSSAFGPEDEEIGADLAAGAAAVLANVAAYWEALELGEQLSQSIKTRAVIEQAKGMLMGARRTMSADEAFELLRAASQRENVKLRDIAQRIVDRRSAVPGDTG